MASPAAYLSLLAANGLRTCRKSGQTGRKAVAEKKAQVPGRVTTAVEDDKESSSHHAKLLAMQDGAMYNRR
jgi:hypothetical protein